MQFADKYTPTPEFVSRYISPEDLHAYLLENFNSDLAMVGTSTDGLPIYMYRFGKGPVNVLAWSQMHGNESNATHAMLDLLHTLMYFPEGREELENAVTLDFIFMLNPDGSKVWSRRNALDIDLNRDYHKQASKEFPILKNIAEKGRYHYALNLHEQRTIFTTDGLHPATLSFLSPSENPERTVTATRQKAMAVIARLFSEMQHILPLRIARYSDEFYPNSTGDNFTAMGLPTVLFEGGHFEGDYQRRKTRKFYAIALYLALRAAGELKGSAYGFEEYFNIPVNRESHFDIIYRNVKLNTDFPCVVDIAVQYREVKKNTEADISFIPVVAEVGDCSNKKGWQEIDGTGKRFISERKFPKLDSEVDFTLV